MPNYWVEPLGLQLHGTAVGSFSNPLSLSGLVAWYDASQITGLTNGQAVATWADLSGNARDATQATASSRPVYVTGVLNGLPAVRFDGSDDILTTTAEAAPITGSTNGTQFAVAIPRRLDGPGFVSMIMIYDAGGGSNSRGLAYLGNSDEWATHDYDGAIKRSQGGTAVLNTPVILVGTANNDTTTQVWINGAAQTATAVGTLFASDTYLALGGNSSAQQFQIDLAECGSYSRVLSSAEIAQLFTYLNTKWAVY